MWEDWLTADRWLLAAVAARDWLADNLLVLSNLWQLLVVGLSLGIVALVAPRLKALLGRPVGPPRVTRLLLRLRPLVLPLVWLLLVGIAWQVAVLQGWPGRVLEITVSLLAAWIAIHVASRLVTNPVWAQAVAVVAWTLAALNILRLLDPTVALLDSVAVSFGALRLSLLTVVKAAFVLAVLLWLATLLMTAVEARIRHSPNLTPSVQVLFTKLMKATLVTMAVLAAISTTGIDLTALAVFGGAIGVGIGFGLQRVVANLFAGLILLLDRSVKPGDVVAVAGTYGWVNTLGGRYVSVVTRDGIEHLIPNEEFITTRVENWTHTDSRVRLKIPLGVHYDSDVERALVLCVRCAADTPRVLAEPAPVCQLRDFGDSRVDLELRIWIGDPMNGVNNVRSDVLRRIWKAFHEESIDIPYPQRDVHLRTVGPVPVRLVGEGEGDGEPAA
jgi:small-conductance mechanosensitive channel